MKVTVMTIGDRLYLLRKDSRLKLEEIEESIGVSYQAYRKYENNICNPSVDTLIKIAKMFNISTDYILGLTDEKRSLK